MPGPDSGRHRCTRQCDCRLASTAPGRIAQSSRPCRDLPGSLEEFGAKYPRVGRGAGGRFQLPKNEGNFSNPYSKRIVLSNVQVMRSSASVTTGDSTRKHLNIKDKSGHSALLAIGASTTSWLFFSSVCHFLGELATAENRFVFDLQSIEQDQIHWVLAEMHPTTHIVHDAAAQQSRPQPHGRVLSSDCGYGRILIAPCSRIRWSQTVLIATHGLTKPG